MEWRKIKSSNDTYEVNKNGDIRRVLGVVDFGKNKRKVGGVILKPKRKSNGYMEVNLKYNNKGNSKYVHRLVCEAFLGDIPKDMCVNHIDGDKSNNNLSNLEVVTYSENSIHAFENKLKIPHRMLGENHPNSKLTNSDVLKFRSLYANGKSAVEISNKYGVNKSTLRNVLCRNTWTHI